MSLARYGFWAIFFSFLICVSIYASDAVIVAKPAAAEEIRQSLVEVPRLSHTSAGIWPDSAPADCPFPKSALFGGVEFTGRRQFYTFADTWYPSWASDGNQYSPFTDGGVDKVRSHSAPPDWTTGNARIEGDDPLNLKVVPIGVHKAFSSPYTGRYPCGSLVYNGIWYYGTYCLDWSVHPWDILGPFVGFRVSRDFGQTWQDTPCTPVKPLFSETIKAFDPKAPMPTNMPNVPADQLHKMPKIKMGSPHFVDFGKNMEHSPDGKAYLLGHGATRPEAACNWISGDQAYLARVTPSPENINDVTKYEFFAGHDARGEPVWAKDFSRIKPLLEWNDHLGCVNATWHPGLKRYLLFVTYGGESGRGTFDTLFLESEKITGPWRRVVWMEKFGQQAYFVNIPSKFISADSRTMWLCYSANWIIVGRFNPPGRYRFGLNLHEIRLLAPEAPELAKPQIMGDGVPWDRLLAPENVARKAKVTASSQKPDCPPESVINGKVGSFWMPLMKEEWSAKDEHVGAWLRLSWDSPQTVNRVWLFDKWDTKVQVMEAELRFSDGSTITVGELPNDAGKGRQIDFPQKTITWLEVRITKTLTTAPIGLSEIAVFKAGLNKRE